MRVKTGGRWTAGGCPLYFFAGLEAYGTLMTKWDLVHCYWGLPWLFSIWYWERRHNMAGNAVRHWTGEGWPLLLDSGVFTAFGRWSREHPGRSSSEWVPEDDPGWSKLDSRHRLVYGDREIMDGVWGAIEVDVGDAEQKTRRRERMEDEYGFGFIPVFHFGSDGWSYLDFLLEGYDRVAVSFLYVRGRDRGRLMLEFWDRWEGSGVWVHALAWTPGNDLSLFPHSMDSTSWTGPSTGGASVPALLGDRGLPVGEERGFRRRTRTAADYYMVNALSILAHDFQARSLRVLEEGRGRWGGGLGWGGRSVGGRVPVVLGDPAPARSVGSLGGSVDGEQLFLY